MNDTDFGALKNKLKNTWMAGDYASFAQYLAPGALEILRSWKISPGSTMLDVGCGAGQTSIPAAKSGVKVTGVDIATNLIDAARARAKAEGVTAKFDEGDAEALPYPDASFDVVISPIGAMFAPRPELVAAELLRVCRPGGRILMANWTPEGLVGEMFRAIAKQLPPPAGVPPAVKWGDEGTVRERLGSGLSELRCTKRLWPEWRYPFSVPEVVQYFIEYYGPTNRAFAALDGSARAQYVTDLEAAFSKFNRGTKQETVLEGEFVDVHGVRAG